MGIISNGFSFYSEDISVKVYDSFVKEQDFLVIKEIILVNLEDDKIQFNLYEFVFEFEVLKDFVVVLEELVRVFGNNGYFFSDVRIVNREVFFVIGNVSEFLVIVVLIVVGFIDLEVDIFDMESYFGDVIDDVGADGQRNVDLEEFVIYF